MDIVNNICYAFFFKTMVIINNISLIFESETKWQNMDTNFNSSLYSIVVFGRRKQSRNVKMEVMAVLKSIGVCLLPHLSSFACSTGSFLQTGPNGRIGLRSFPYSERKRSILHLSHFHPQSVSIVPTVTNLSDETRRGLFPFWLPYIGWVGCTGTSLSTDIKEDNIKLCHP